MDKKLSCGWHASRTLVRVVLSILHSASHDLLAGFFDSQSFTRGQLLTAYWSHFPTFTYHSPIRRHQWGGSPRAIGFIFGMAKLEWLSYSLVKVAWLPTVVWAQNINVTATQPRRYNNSRPTALRSGGKNFGEKHPGIYEKWQFHCFRRGTFLTHPVHRGLQ